MTYFIQGGGNSEFPFFPEQPGNGNGNPPPFGEPTANLDQYISLLLILATILIIFIAKKKIKQ